MSLKHGTNMKTEIKQKAELCAIKNGAFIVSPASLEYLNPHIFPHSFTYANRNFCKTIISGNTNYRLVLFQYSSVHSVTQ